MPNWRRPFTIAATVSGQNGGATGSDFRASTGVVKSFSGSSFVLDVRGNELGFAIAPETRLIAKGGPSDLVLRDRKEQSRRWFAKRITARDRVKVTFRPSENALTAVEIRVIER